MLSVSLDGSTAERHDAIRGVPGSYQQTVEAIGWAKEAGLPLQINTLVCAETLDDVPATGQLLADLKVERWSLFFLVPTGRGRVLREITPDESERLSHWLWDASPTAPYVIKTTEAHHYRRIALEQSSANGQTEQRVASLRRGFGIRDGAGIMFISHIGEIYPAGFLPLAAGDVHLDDPVQVYREAPLFQALRDVNRFKGKCGRCEYKVICGGSRSRAYAYTGDPLESDPLCPYEPVAGTANEREAIAAAGGE